jgi:nucleotide-binding universal stress UspA family protein
MTQKTYRIVVGTDFSDTAHVALKSAFEIASKEAKAEVHVVNAVQHLGEFVQMDLPEVPAYRLPLDEAQEKLEAYVGSRLSAWQGETDKTFSRCVTYLSTDYPAQAVVQLATDLEADLIIVGTHGRQGFRRFLLGSVAEGVVRMAHCPVLVVRPEDKTAHVPEIEPPCPQCLETRRETHGAELWCARHSEKHAARHVYHYDDRNSRESNVGSFSGLNR